MTNEKAALRKYFRQFQGKEVQVAVEACGFWPAFREVVEAEVTRLVLVHPQRVEAIASAQLKNDRVDSETLAHLLRCDLLPESWKADRASGGSRCGCGRRWCGIGRFHDQEALCSYAGLVPRVRESAGKAARSGITRQGSSWMRWIMVEAAQVATRCSPAAKRYYERLLRKKHKHVARVALVRKLLIAVYALLHDGIVFEEEKFAAR